MADQQTNWILELVDKITAPVKEVTAGIDKLEDAITTVDIKLGKVGEDSAKAFEKSNTSLKLLAVQAGSEAITNLGQPLLEGAKGAYAYDASLKELSAITGVVGDDLGLIGKNARQSAVDLGGDAAESVKSYTLLLSKLTPEIAKSPEALDMMGTSVGLLSETMHGDLVGASNSASSAMNQFGVDMSDPIAAAKEMDVMLNQMVASAKVGSQEVPAVAAALDEVGAVADAANVTFAETNGALQVLGKYGKEGAEGGRALRNVLAVLGKEDFLPKEVLTQLKQAGIDTSILADKNKTLAERITELKKLGGNDALLGAMFGTENTVAITGLLGNVELLKDYTTQITEDQTALADMAATMGTSYQESKDRIVSYFDDIKLSIYGATGSMLPFLDIGLQGIMGMINLAPGIMAMVEVYRLLREATMLQTAAQWLLNIAMNANPIGLIITGVAALIGLVAVVITYFDDWGASLATFLGPLGLVVSLVQSFIKHWDSITDAFSKGGIVAGIKRIGLVLLDALIYPVQQLLEILSHIPGLGKLAGGGAKFIKEIRTKLELTEADPKKEKGKATNKVINPESKQKESNTTPISPSSIGADKSGGTNSTGGKIITMTLNVYNTYKVAKEDLANFEKITEHVVGRINDTMKDALIAAGS
jgi:TP901 family phage tail tape measure protein